MPIQGQTKAVQYIHVASDRGWESEAHVKRHKNTIAGYCNKNELTLAYSFVDIGGGGQPAQREGRAAALDVLCSGKALVLVVPSLVHLSRVTTDVVEITARYFVGSEPIGALVAVAEGIDSRRAEGRIALDVLRCMAGLSVSTRRNHA